VGISASIFMLALGAILVWAVHIHVGWLDLRVVGWILMAAGFLGLILTVWFWSNRRRRAVTPDPVERERALHEDDTVQRRRF
jgi:hypothetical protein